ncbi:MAG: TlpA family protein disulfide reductase [Candidatus Aminicenantes bacterium]|nr:TlpA family protein disulfide reductase [Candidatus Aminicenantes bacterium]
MKRFKWLFIPLALMLVLSVYAENAIAQEKDYPDAPDFTLTDLSGNKISLSGLNGKVIFLNFWATWCPPCKKEIPGFIEIYEKYKDQEMVIVGISLDKTGTDSVRDFVEKVKITYPVAMGTNDIVNDYKPGRFIPTTIIVDKNGKIRHKHVGYMDKDTLEKNFLDLNKE